MCIRDRLPAYRSVAGDLKLSYAQFEELERFSRYGTRLEEEKRRMLERGRRVREVLKQGQFDLMTPGEQIIVLLAVTEGLMEDVPAEETRKVARMVRADVKETCAEVLEALERGEKLSDEHLDALREAITKAVKQTGRQGEANGDDRESAQTDR